MAIKYLFTLVLLGTKNLKPPTLRGRIKMISTRWASTTTTIFHLMGHPRIIMVCYIMQNNHTHAQLAWHITTKIYSLFILLYLLIRDDNYRLSRKLKLTKTILFTFCFIIKVSCSKFILTRYTRFEYSKSNYSLL